MVDPLTDALGTGLPFGSVTNAGAYIRSASGNVRICTLPASRAPGRYVATYTATVDHHATTGSGCANVHDCVVIIPVFPGARTRKTTDPVDLVDLVDPVGVGDTSYNTAPGMRRARRVREALFERLSPEVRFKVREAVDDSKAPVQASHEYATRSCGP